LPCGVRRRETRVSHSGFLHATRELSLLSSRPNVRKTTERRDKKPAFGTAFQISLGQASRMMAHRRDEKPVFGTASPSWHSLSLALIAHRMRGARDKKPDYGKIPSQIRPLPLPAQSCAAYRQRIPKFVAATPPGGELNALKYLKLGFQKPKKSSRC
jgi:hypothetical protein